MKGKRRARLVLSVLMFVSLIFAPVMATEFGDPDSLQDPYFGLQLVDRISVDDAVKESTVYWCSLIADENTRINYFQRIDKAPSLASDEKELLKKSLQTVWDAHPVEEKKVQSDHGTVTYISFADGSITSLTQDEQNSLEQLENVLSETYVADPGLQWTTSEHEKYMRAAGSRLDLPFSDDAVAACVEPDTIPAVPIPDDIINQMLPLAGLVRNALISSFNGVFHSVTHAYDPEFIGGCGLAPNEAKKYADMAYDNYKAGDFRNAAKNVGYASHFISDCGNPLHTGMFVQQVCDFAANPGSPSTCVHGRYESYVNRNWEARFNETVFNTPEILGNTDWAEGCKTLARLSHEDSDTIYQIVHDARSDGELDANGNLRTLALNRARFSIKYVQGLVWYVMRM